MKTCGDSGRPGCGREIAFGLTPDGKRIPLDLTAPVYCVGPWDETAQAFRVERASIGYRVSHFATCAKASNFSRGAKPSGA